MRQTPRGATQRTEPLSDLDSTKQCSKCRETKPATREFFYSNKDAKDGFCSPCKTCKGIQQKRYYQENREKTQAVNRRWLEENRDKYAEYKKRYYREHRQEAAEYGQRHYNENRETYAENGKRYYQENREEVLERARRWREENPEAFRAALRNRKARLRNAEGSHTEAEISQMLEDQGHLCAYCEVPLFGAFHVDHMIPISRGGRNDWTNLAVVCPTCNLRKYARTTEEFICGLS